MNYIKTLIESVLLKRLCATLAQIAVSYAATHSLSNGITDALGVTVHITIDPVKFQTGCFAFTMAGLEWVRHELSKKLPANLWI